LPEVCICVLNMTTYEIGSAYRIHAIRIPLEHESGFLSNAYLIEDDSLTLIDTGCYSLEARQLIYETLDCLGRKISELERIIITHGHVDHYGFARQCAELSGASVYIHRDDYHKVAGSHARDFNENYSIMESFLLEMNMTRAEIKDTRNAINKFGDYAEQLPDCELVDEGDTFSVGKVQLKVIHCPGHTPGSICLYDKANGILFSGDHLLLDRIPNAVIEPIWGKGRKYRSLASYTNSLKRISRLPVELVFPGHGVVFNDVLTPVEKIQDYFETLEKKVVEVMGDRKIQPAEIAREIDSTLGGVHLFLKISDILGILEMLEVNGLAQICVGKGRGVWRLEKECHSATNN